MDAVFAGLVDEIRPDVAYIGHLNHLSTGIVDVLSDRKIPIVFMLHDYWLMCPRGQFLMRSIGRGNNFMLCPGQSDEKCARDCYEVYFSGREDTRTADMATWTNWIHRRMEETRTMIQKVNLFIAPSNYLRERFVRDFGISENKITYLDYGFPLENLQPVERTRDASGDNEYTFGYIGTHIPAKGVNLLIEAFFSVKGNARLKIFGRENGQSTRALKEMARAARGRIEFCGEYINSELRQKVFAHVDAIVVPSIWMENSPLVIHEAEACRVPVITADAGGMAEYVHHRKNGLLFRHCDADSLAEQMQWALEHQNEMKQFGKRGYLYSADGHVPSIEEHCRKLLSIFQEVSK